MEFSAFEVSRSKLWRKDQIYPRHCGKQTSKLSQIQNKKNSIYFQLYFAGHLLTEQR